MLGSAIGALSERIDAKFLTAFWLPAFVFLLGVLGILGLRVGPGQIDAWVSGLDSVEQTLGVLIFVLLISMLALLLRSLTHPITELFAGVALPRPVAQWSTRGQRRAKARTATLLSEEEPQEADSLLTATNLWLQQRYPTDDADMRPTLFGNMLASVGEHPRFAYAMEGALWWPRLAPLLPGYFQDTLAAAQAPMMALFNLSLAFFALGPVAVAILGFGGGNWATAFSVLVVTLLFSWLAYRAAVSQATEVGSLLRVAFDLYRRDILEQLGLPEPTDLATERTLWLQLTRQTLALPEQTAMAEATPGEPG